MAKKRENPPAESLVPAIRDRVKELRRVPASELRANPANWRLHPEEQKGALQSVLDDVGFVGAVIARETPAGLELLDGHLRADVAGDEQVPVIVVDLNDEEAAKVLATYDPLSSLAKVDGDAFKQLLDDFNLDDAFGDDAHLRKMLSDVSYQLERAERRAAKRAAETGEENDFEHDVPGMALQPHEHYDYLVVLATTTHEWNVLCDRLGLVPEKRRKRMGTCRAIRASALLPLLKKD